MACDVCGGAIIDSYDIKWWQPFLGLKEWPEMTASELSLQSVVFHALYLFYVGPWDYSEWVNEWDLMCNKASNFFLFFIFETPF